MTLRCCTLVSAKVIAGEIICMFDSVTIVLTVAAAIALEKAISEMIGDAG